MRRRKRSCLGRGFRHHYHPSLYGPGDAESPPLVVDDRLGQTEPSGDCCVALDAREDDLVVGPHVASRQAVIFGMLLQLPHERRDVPLEFWRFGAAKSKDSSPHDTLPVCLVAEMDHTRQRNTDDEQIRGDQSRD
jgi:hypothetical protein